MHAGNNPFTALPTPAVFTVTEFDVIYNLVSPLVETVIFYVLMSRILPKR